MKRTVARWGSLLLLWILWALPAGAEEGRLVHGATYEGVILTPRSVRDFGAYQRGSLGTGVWVPSLDMVRKAEARLPGAIAERAVPPKIVATYYVPRYFTPKAGRPAASPGNERLEDNITDSVEDDNFLYDVRPNLKDYTRQYLGVTVNGRKFVLINFVHAVCIDDDYVKKTWKHAWVDALDAGDLIWDVRYDPASGTFSEWNG